MSEGTHLKGSQASSKPGSLAYRPAFDGLRGLAVCMVAMYHVDKTFVPGGWAGVDIFFVLSGFLITNILIRELKLKNEISLRNFYARRILRLVPALWCLLACVAITAPFRSHPRLVLEAVVASGTYLINWTRAFDMWPQDVLGHTWSLAIEEQFYIVWPVLLLSVYKRKPVRWVATILIAVLLWRYVLVALEANTVRIYTGFDTHSDGLLVGCLMALVPSSAILSKRAALTSAIPITLLIAIIIDFDLQNKSVQIGGFFLVAILAAWLILGAQASGRLQMWLSIPPLVYTGRISYGRVFQAPRDARS